VSGVGLDATGASAIAIGLISWFSSSLCVEG
jgi:hypothetical protein